MTIKITDEMVNRCRAWFVEQFGTNHNIDKTREMLDRTLNPKPAEEIPVSEGIILAGARVYADKAYASSPADWKPAQWLHDFMAKLYRAMESVRRKEESEAALRRGETKPFVFAGMPVQLDPSLPPDRIEIRRKDGLTYSITVAP